MTLSLTVNDSTLKWLSSLPTLMQKSFWWRQCRDRYIISPPPPPHLHTPFPPFSPSLISLMVSVDVKHHVYLLTYLPSPRPDKHGFRLWTLSTMFTFFPPQRSQSSGAVWKSMWPSWAPRLHQWLSLMVSVDVKQHWTMHTHCRSQFVPHMSTRHPRTLSSTSSSVISKGQSSAAAVWRSSWPSCDSVT